MLDELFTRSWFDWMPNISPWVYLPSRTVAIAAVFAGAGAVILSRFTANMGNLTYPINYGTLFVAALLSNWMLQEVKLPMDPNLQTPIVFSFAGITVASLALMAILRKE